MHYSVWATDLSFQFKKFQFGNLSFINVKPQSRPDKVKALYAGSTGIHYQHVPFRITHHLQDMRMTAYEYIGTIPVYQDTCLYVISPRITSYMGHKNLHPLAFKETVQRVYETKVVVIAIAGNTDNRLEGGQLFSQVHASAEITGMPYLVHRLKKLAELPAEYAMRI